MRLPTPRPPFGVWFLWFAACISYSTAVLLRVPPHCCALRSVALALARYQRFCGPALTYRAILRIAL